MLICGILVLWYWNLENFYVQGILKICALFIILSVCSLIACQRSNINLHVWKFFLSDKSFWFQGKNWQFWGGKYTVSCFYRWLFKILYCSIWTYVVSYYNKCIVKQKERKILGSILKSKTRLKISCFAIFWQKYVLLKFTKMYFILFINSKSAICTNWL